METNRKKTDGKKSKIKERKKEKRKENEATHLPSAFFRPVLPAAAESLLGSSFQFELKSSWNRVETELELQCWFKEVKHVASFVERKRERKKRGKMSCLSARFQWAAWNSSRCRHIWTLFPVDFLFWILYYLKYFRSELTNISLNEEEIIKIQTQKKKGKEMDLFIYGRLRPDEMQTQEETMWQRCRSQFHFCMILNNSNLQNNIYSFFSPNSIWFNLGENSIWSNLATFSIRFSFLYDFWT